MVEGCWKELDGVSGGWNIVEIVDVIVDSYLGTCGIERGLEMIEIEEVGERYWTAPCTGGEGEHFRDDETGSCMLSGCALGCGRGRMCTSSFNSVPQTIQEYIAYIGDPSFRSFAFEDQPRYPFLLLAKLDNGAVVEGAINVVRKSLLYEYSFIPLHHLRKSPLVIMLHNGRVDRKQPEGDQENEETTGNFDGKSCSWGVDNLGGMSN